MTDGTSNPVIQLCIEGIQAEYLGQVEKARLLYQKAWETAQDDYEACAAAHYVAHLEEDPGQKLMWNQVALEKAQASPDPLVQDFYPSLYLNMGQSYETLGNLEEARRYYDLAEKLGVKHHMK
jgi:tetratricopeptide (TPR) repeat protein